MRRNFVVALLALATSSLVSSSDTAEKEGVPASTPIETAIPAPSGNVLPSNEELDAIKQILQTTRALEDQYTATMKKIAADGADKASQIVQKLMAEMDDNANTTSSQPAEGGKEASNPTTGQSDNEKELRDIFLKTIEQRNQLNAAREKLNSKGVDSDAFINGILYDMRKPDGDSESPAGTNPPSTGPVA